MPLNRTITAIIRN